MIDLIDIENFKAFGSRARAEFAPITLIYGPNSIGKSSILNALKLLKQTADTPDANIGLVPRKDDGLVDFGGYREMVHGHDMSKAMRFRVDVSLDNEPPQIERFDTDAVDRRTIGISLTFQRDSDTSKINVTSVETYFAGQLSPVARFEPRTADDVSGYEGEGISSGSSNWNQNYSDASFATFFQCTYLSNDEMYWKKSYQSVVSQREEIAQSLVRLESILQNNSAYRKRFSNVDDDAIEAAKQFYSREFSLEEYVARMTNAELATRVYMWSIFPMEEFVWPQRVSGLAAACPELINFDGIPPAQTRGIAWTIDGVGMAGLVGDLLREHLESLVPLGPNRRAPERLYIFRGTAPRDVGYSGQFLTDLLFSDASIVDKTNQWMARLDIGYELQIERLGESVSDIYEVRLTDTKGAGTVKLSLPDVGFGVSQVLPIIVQILASKNRTMLIEQPELHIHPRLQADLADLLIAGIRSPHNHQFIIETHSEHLVLRLLRRIRETYNNQLEDDGLSLRPEDISVLYVSHGDNGAKIRRLRVNEEGDFIDNWPHGFFDERAKELF